MEIIIYLKGEPMNKLLNSEAKSIIDTKMNQMINLLNDALYIQASETVSPNSLEFDEYYNKLVDASMEYIYKRVERDDLWQ